MERIYLDYAASTPVDPEVLRAMERYFAAKFGNPGSVHSFGQEAIAAVDASREAIAASVGAEFREIIFTGSVTEANNLALRGAAAEFRKKFPAARPRIIVSAIEHESVLETAGELEREGAEVVFLPVNQAGIVDEKTIKRSLTENTALVSVIYANNEIGTIQPIKAIAAAIKDFRDMRPFPLFHTDAVQAFQFLDCDVRDLGVDLMTLSAHKLYGPKGVGALYVKNFGKKESANALGPIIFGGGQEFGLRSGTENVPSIVGFAKAAELAVRARASERERIAGLRDQFFAGLKNICPQAEVNGAAIDAAATAADRLPNILNVYFPGRAAQDVLTRLDLHGLAASSGSACRSRALEASHVVSALGHSKERAASSVRFSFGRPTTPAEIEAALAVVRETFL